MAYVIINDKHLEAIADALRKVGGKETYKPREMAPDIERLSGGTGFNGLLGLYFKGVDVPGAAFELMIEDCINEDGTLFLPENMWGGKTIKGDIVIPYGIIEIPNNYFKDVEGITDIDFPLGLTTIGTGAFRNAINGPNDTITLGLDVTNIGQYAFADNTLKVFRTSENEVAIDDYAFQNIILEKLELNGEVSIGNNAFQNASINEIEINGTVSIGEEAFAHSSTTSADTTALKKITINGEITSLGSYAFENNTALTDVIGELSTIPSGLFCRCNSLENVTLSDDITSIGDEAFAGTAFDNIVIPANVITIGAHAFESCGKPANSDNWYPHTTVTFNDKLQNIGESAFQRCGPLYEITLPESLQTIGVSAFQECGLYRINIPGGVKTISAYAFYNCPLEKVTLNEGLKVIKDYAFAYTGTSSYSVKCPSTLKRIGSNAFANSRLYYISLNEGLETIEDFAFSGTYMNGIGFPSSLESLNTSILNDSDDTPLSVLEFNLSPNHQLRLSGSPIRMRDPYNGTNKITFKGQNGQIPTSSTNYLFVHPSVNNVNTVISVPWSQSENPQGFPWGATSATIKYNNGL